MKKYFELIRIKHWTKNFLVFLPLFFSGNILNVNILLISIISFFIFSFSSSIVYIINDIFDIENDKLHPVKKNRPLASGKVSIKVAYYILLFLFIIISLLISYLFYKVNSLFIIIIPLTYIIINLLYSFILKNIPIIDILIVIFGFILRVVYGGISTNITISKYLYLLIIFGSYYLIFGKRRGEIIKINSQSRKVLNKYNKDFLDRNMYVSYGITIMSYILWCIEYNNNYIFWTIPLFISILELYSLDVEKDSYADPIDIILNNKILIISIFIYLIVLFILIYF